MNDRQLMKRCMSLAEKECANYFSRECVPEVCKCHLINTHYPTIEEGTLNCDWFLEAVLPLERELNKAVWQALTGQDGPTRARCRICEICRGTFIPASPRQKYCPVCGENEKRKRSRAKQHRYDERKRIKNNA